MLKSYFITGVRNMLRHAAPSTINIVGLSVAIGCAITVFVLINTYYNLDTMHEKAKRIGLVINHVKNFDDIQKQAYSPHPLAEYLINNTAIEKVVTVITGRASVRAGDKVFSERIHFVSSEYLNIFSFEVQSGNRQSLNDKSQLILTEDMAVKYFGNKNAVGQILSLKFTDQYKQEFTVGAVLENTPANSSMNFNFLIPSIVWEDMTRDQLEDWTKNPSVTFMLLKEGHNFNELNPLFDELKKVQNQANQINPIQRIEAIPMLKVARNSDDISGSLSWGEPLATFIAFGIIATFLIIIACLNYMNVAVASVSTRLKEIGIRKAIGGGKSEITQQFLAENLLLCFIALIIGTILAYFILIPGFNSLYTVKIAFEISTWKVVIGFFTALLIFVALISGAYPAMYVSSFNALKILRGREKFGNKSTFSKILLTTQFTLSITTIMGCLVFVWATYSFEDKDWGYQPNNIIVAPLSDSRFFEELKNIMSSNKSVKNLAGAAQHIGRTYKQTTFVFNGEEHATSHLEVGFRYLECININLSAGRFFDESIESDKSESMIVNETFAKKMGWSDPLGQSFEWKGQKRYVIGVAKDFHFESFHRKIKPAMFSITSPDNFNYLVVKTESGTAGIVAENLKSIWHKVTPDDPYTGFLQQDVFEDFFRSNRANSKVTYFVSIIALLLVIMGLYGLISYSLIRRLKEFSIRKVFGASIFQIFRLMNKDYLLIVIVSSLVGSIFGAYLMNLLLKSFYPDPVLIGFSPYAITIFVIFTTVIATILSQLRRVTRENPTITLKID